MELLACAWGRSHGVAALGRDFLDPWLANEPPFVLSDAFPGDSIPAPAALSLLRDWPREDRKKVKRTLWLTPDDFSAVQSGSRPGLAIMPATVENHVRLRSTIPRASVEKGDTVELFEIPYSTLSNPNAGLTVLARATRHGLQVLMESLEMLGRTGFGADASVGHGGFTTREDPAPWGQLDDVPNANGFVALSTYQPGPGDPVHGYWQTFVKYGKMAPEFHGSVVFKRPQVMLKPGACFRTNGRPGPYYGTSIRSADLLGDRGQDALAARGVYPVQAAFALAVPMRWPTEETA